MNSDTKWRELNHGIKATFGKLTDEDLLQADGNTDKLISALQKRYGYTKSKAQTEWNKFTFPYNKLSEQVKPDIDAAVNALKAAASSNSDIGPQ